MDRLGVRTTAVTTDGTESLQTSVANSEISSHRSSRIDKARGIDKTLGMATDTTFSPVIVGDPRGSTQSAKVQTLRDVSSPKEI